VVVVGAPVECVALLADHGVLALPASRTDDGTGHDLVELVRGGAAADASVVLVPATAGSKPLAEAAASALSSEGRVVDVLRTQTFVQALAAASVHDRSLDHDADVHGMAQAAGSVRWAQVRADEPLGDVPAAVDRLLGSGGELLTVLALRPSDLTNGADDPALTLVLEQARRYPHVEVTVLPTVESDVRLLQLGAE
jgi:hypothetical protein